MRRGANAADKNQFPSRDQVFHYGQVYKRSGHGCWLLAGPRSWTFYASPFDRTSCMLSTRMVAMARDQFGRYITTGGVAETVPLSVGVYKSKPLNIRNNIVENVNKVLTILISRCEEKLYRIQVRRPAQPTAEPVSFLRIFRCNVRLKFFQFYTDLVGEGRICGTERKSPKNAYRS